MHSLSFAQVRSVLTKRLSRWCRVTAAVVALICAWLLAPRPLTTLTVLGITLGVAILGIGIRSIIGGHTLAIRSLGTFIATGGLAGVIWWGRVVAVLPIAGAASIAAAFAWLLYASIRSRRHGAAVRAGVRAATAIGAVGISLAWPDVAAVLTAYTFVGMLAFIAALLIIPAPRRAGRGVLSGISTAVAACLVATVGVGGLMLEAHQPQPDEFYTWGQAIPAQPGVLLRTAEFAGETPSDARSLRILYTTKDVQDQIRVASAVVAIPTAEADSPRPVLAWQHGTTGVTSACAPSVTGDALTEIGIPGIGEAIQRGWVVVATDYPGQGTSGAYPYLIGVGEGRATLDAVRALGQVPDANASRRAMLWGHSQGGHATLWAAQLADEYAPEIEVLGVAALSAASDPYTLATGIVAAAPSAATSLIFSYVLIPYADAYPDVTIRDSVDPAGEAFTQAAATRCATSPTTVLTIISSTLLLHDRPLYTLDLQGSAISRRLKENVAEGTFAAPLFLGQGVDDEVIPIGIQRTFATRACMTPRSVTVREYEGKTHLGVIAPDSPLIDDLYSWADATLDGVMTKTCDLDD